MEFEDGLVNYEAFGAQGDGVADDMQAICEAHETRTGWGFGPSPVSPTTSAAGR
jgi:hypothetical protein